MSNQGKSELAATDLPIALYLNQRLTFDVLASIGKWVLSLFD